MKVCDFELYRAEYCGLCKQLGHDYGLLSRFLLNYDLVLLAVLADALSGQKGLLLQEGCFVNPAMKRAIRHDTSGLNLASDGLILLSYHKLMDNLEDERSFKRMFYCLAHPILRAKHRKAAAKRPEVEAMLHRQMENQRLLEKESCAHIDEACDPTAQMCAVLFAEAATKEDEKHILWRLGLFAGQIVYLLDAAEDYDDDAQKGRYNVFLKAGLTREAAIETSKARCKMAAGEMALCYNLLHLKQYKSILDNIFFLGLPFGIANAGQKRQQRRAGHGQIDSV